MKHGLSPEIVEGFCAVFRRYPEIERVLLFGSRAAGNFRDGSDIDLAVLAPAMNKARFTALWNEVDALPIVFKTDLLHWDVLGKAELRGTSWSARNRGAAALARGQRCVVEKVDGLMLWVRPE